MILTATNERVQAYMHLKPRPSKALKNARLLKFNELLHQAGKFITELFPRKQQKVLDEILYMTSGCGIAKIGLDKLSERAGVSNRTTATVVKKLKENDDQFLVARINAGQAGKYIFVDKQHPNFLEVMEYVFHLNAIQIASHFATLENAETVDTTDANDENESPNCFNSFISSFKTSFINDDNNTTLDEEAVQEIQNEIESTPVQTIDEQKVLLDQYATNEYQTLYFDMMLLFPLHDEIMSNLYKLALRVGSDATLRHVHVAKSVTFELNMQLHERTTVIKESVVALFSELYKKALEAPVKAKEEVKSVVPARSVPFYNWLEEREETMPVETPAAPELNTENPSNDTENDAAYFAMQRELILQKLKG